MNFPSCYDIIPVLLMKLEKKRGKSDLITKMYLQGIYNKRQSSMSKGQGKCCIRHCTSALVSDPDPYPWVY